MGQDGLTGLRTCLQDAEWNSVKSKLGRGSKSAPQICDRHFRQIFDLGSLISYPESMPIQRGRLRETLLVQPERRNMIRYSKLVTGYHVIAEAPREQIRLQFEDGTEAVGDLVIAADGSKSVLNHLTGLRNRYLTDVRCITARINVTRPDIVQSLPPTLQAGPVMFGLGARSVCFSSLYLPVLDDPKSSYHKSSTLMWALAVGADFWKETLGYDPEEEFRDGKIDPQDLFETALDLSDHWKSPALKTVLTADPVASIGYGAFRSSSRPRPAWRTEARLRLGRGAGADRIWFMGDSIHAMTRNFIRCSASLLLAGRGMGGNQALRDAGSLAQLLPMMIRESYGTVTDDIVQKHLIAYEEEMIPRGFKWVKASEEGHDLFDTDTVGGKLKFWMIISIMRIIKYIGVFIVLFIQIFIGKRKSLIERVER